jgi:outer membrane protein TolC
MFSNFGRKPLLLLVLTSTVALSAHARQSLPLTLAEAENLALGQEPGRASLLARADAFEEESVAAGQLPDPMLRVGLMNYPVEAGGFSTEGMTQAQLGIRQAFPPGNTRKLSANRFESLATEMREHADGRERDVLTAVRQAWLEAYYWKRAHAMVSEARPFFADLVVVTRSLYSVGRRDQQDLLLAELELSQIDDRLIEIEKQRARAVAGLSEWAGSDAYRPVADKFPAWQDLPSLEMLEANLLAHPSLQAANARIDARQHGVDLAEQRKKPGWAVDLGYGYREGLLSNGDPRSDMVSLSVSLDLPFFQKNRQDRKVAAALSQKRAAIDSREETLRRLRTRLRNEYVRWTDLDRRIDLYEQRILTLAEDQAQAALLAYQSDAADFADVMRGFIGDLNTRVQHIRLQVEQAQSYAALANLGGLPR